MLLARSPAWSTWSAPPPLRSLPRPCSPPSPPGELPHRSLACGVDCPTECANGARACDGAEGCLLSEQSSSNSALQFKVRRWKPSRADDSQAVSLALGVEAPRTTPRRLESGAQPGPRPMFSKPRLRPSPDHVPSCEGMPPALYASRLVLPKLLEALAAQPGNWIGGARGVSPALSSAQAGSSARIAAIALKSGATQPHGGRATPCTSRTRPLSPAAQEDSKKASSES
mmetsp:Transcript_29827/g.81850  ORF Transcript_29827/g.81850 Transcript_29827/m.81850 type:complete len:228 (-) Transcript_29827:1-684(-)